MQQFCGRRGTRCGWALREGCVHTRRWLVLEVVVTVVAASGAVLLVVADRQGGDRIGNAARDSVFEKLEVEKL